VCRQTDAVGGDVDGAMNVLQIVVKPFQLAARHGATYTWLVSATGRNYTQHVSAQLMMTR